MASHQGLDQRGGERIGSHQFLSLANLWPCEEIIASRQKRWTDCFPDSRTKHVRAHWAEILRLATAIQQGTVTTSLRLRKQGCYLSSLG